MPSPLIDIPEDDIFKNDRLGLEPAIAARTQALLSRSPQAIAIDGQWGCGKSTFLALWAAYLRCQDIKVVQLNAWKSFESDPFYALTKEILRQVGIPEGEKKPSHKRLFDFVRQSASIVAQGTKLVSMLHPELEDVSQAVGMGIEAANHISKYESNEGGNARFDSPEEFASVLSDAAKTWSKSPIVVMIDELDRCDPEYSVDMLQLLEHVFHAKNVVFVVAVNLSELTHSIRSFYGQGFNAEGYLERFFDDILPLPASNRRQYIKSSLTPMISAERSDALLFLDASGLSLREIDKAVQILRSAIAISAIDIRSSKGIFFTSLWIARTLTPVEYRQFISGMISERTIVDSIFAKGTCKSLRAEGQTNENECAQQIEQILMVASYVLSRDTDRPSYASSIDKTELYRHYQHIVDDSVLDANVPLPYAQAIIKWASRFSNDPNLPSDGDNVRWAARLLDRETPPQ